MTILLTGATGFIGSEVARQLAATSRRLWAELDLVPRYRGVLEGIPVCLDRSVPLAPSRV